MIPKLPLCFALAVALLAPAAAVERLPVADFARQPEASRARLSPDGRHLAFVRDHDGRPAVHVAEVDSGALSWIDVGEAALADGVRKGVGGFAWVGDRRLFITTTVWHAVYGVLAVDFDGHRPVPISGHEGDRFNLPGSRFVPREVIYRFFDGEQNVLMLDRHEGGSGSYNHPDVLRVRGEDGLARVVVKNPGEVVAWGADHRGAVRFGVLRHGDLSGAIYRENAAAPWRAILPLQDRTGLMRPLGFDASLGRVLVAALTPAKRWTIFALDPATGQLGEPLVDDAEYDILPEGFNPSIDGQSLARPLFTPRGDRLLGIRYLTDAPRVKWLDSEYAGYQRMIDRMLPDTVNLLVDASLDGTRQLWLAYSDQQPGVYYLVDTARKAVRRLASRMGWIKPAQMAPTLAIKYQARDGLLIHGFLTVPAGHEPKGLPLVVLPHGGPWVRDIWGFDPLVQLLANRGYGVLQMNYRGSPGYGEQLYRDARRQIGRKIQDDIEDATRWAVAAGVADPARLAIFGSSYGGYSALFALGHNPELYRCGISFAGVTDWPAIFDDRRTDPAGQSAFRFWRREIGDPDQDRDFLRSISPVNFADRIKAPVLIIQGRNDRVVPEDQARRMITALERTGRRPESLFLSDQGHDLASEKNRTAIFQHVVDFLEQHLGPGVK
ncbi:MAG: S9 family peptidase [Verrucomicrobia bacterium]|nr:S9 family peptidase [Verrucomicrobiota bacterium]